MNALMITLLRGWRVFHWQPSGTRICVYLRHPDFPKGYLTEWVESRA
jgi:hypothetical protein